MAVELGLVGLALFFAMLFFTLLNLSRLRRAAKKSGDAFMYSISTALGNGLIGFAIAAFFLSGMHARVFWFSIFLSTCLPVYLAKAPVKTAGDDANLETRAEVPDHAPANTAEQQPAAVEAAREEQRTTKVANDIELRVDQLRIH